MYQYINKIVTIIFVHNWIAILYFNFKKLPLNKLSNYHLTFTIKYDSKILKEKSL